MQAKLTKSQAVAADIAALLRARNPLIWITTAEERRVQRYIMEAAAAAGYICRTWDVGNGVCDANGDANTAIGSNDPSETLNAIRDRARGTQNERCVWVMRDLPPWLSGLSNAATLRVLRNLAGMLPGIRRDNAQAIIVLSPDANIPPELRVDATAIEWPLPDRAEIAAILDATLNSLPEAMRDSAAPNGKRELAIDAAIGLSGEEASACYARSLVQLKRIDPATVANDKRKVIAKEKLLEWHDPIPGGLNAVGGLVILKAWLLQRAEAYSPKARAYGLPAPRGALLVGISGCGKSYIAKAVATAWQIPLLRLDFGAIKSKYVGESEANLRKVFRLLEAVGRCVLWIDEIEKALGGAIGGAADGGVSSDALGALLSWMQERTSETFVFATANNVSGLPPELLRRGRFDEIWFVDLPNITERIEIVRAALKSNGRSLDPAMVNHALVADACDGFTGSEIASLVPEAMFAAFADDAREITTEDMLDAARRVVPLSKTSAERIAALRAWAGSRARNASLAVQQERKQAANVRIVDL